MRLPPLQCGQSIMIGTAMNNPLQEISSVFMFDVSSQKKINDLIDRYESKSSTEKQAFVLALVADLVSVRTRLKLLEKRHIKETN